MFISTLAAIVLLGSAVLASPIPSPDPNCSTDRSILKSCKELTLDQDGHTLKASCLDCNQAWSPTSLDLDQVLGNDHGNFVWDQKSFSLSARDSSLNSETAELSANLKTGGSYDGEFEEEPEQKGTIVLANRIQNVGGYLTFV
ncbi:hypothetical protein BGZ95_007440 [Linnemannia exigua]|uniref:Cyanovirin-N domain-containing protein n=1 Tax=Linnemannia exigua TaxID=604196 RepID=A0AAD4DFG1_9FUNG|nr:hypothetical protein BGZ95_007440 [Linnemannia exigua]